MIDALVSSLPYWHHIAPIWTRLQATGHAGTLYSTGRTATQIGAQQGTPPGDHPVLVAAARDLARLPAHCPTVYTTHGAGQCYSGVPNSLINTPHQRLQQIGLALSPNDQWTANMLRLGVNTVTVGVPKMDNPPSPPDWHDGPPRVGMVFHWDQRTVPESGSAFDEYCHVFADLTARYAVSATHHPRAGYQRSHRRSKRRTRVDWYDAAGVTFYEDLGDVLACSDVIVADNTSVMFEVAAAGWPVVVLDSRRYRLAVEHGLRFWDWADIGPRIQTPDKLAEAVAEAWLLESEWAFERGDMTAAVFPYWGEATGRAAAAIVDWLD